MAEDEIIDLQSIIDSGLEKPAKKKVNEIIDEVFEKQDPMSLTDLLAGSGIIEQEEDVSLAIFEEPKVDEPKAEIITASGTKTEIRTRDPFIDPDPADIKPMPIPKVEVIKEEIPKPPERVILDEILISAIEKAKESEEEPEEIITDEATEFAVDSVDQPEFEIPDGYANDIDQGILEFAHDASFLRQEVVDGNIYETGWVEFSDFDSAILGREVGEPIEHGLETEMSSLETKVHMRLIDRTSLNVLEEVQLENNNVINNKGIVVKHLNGDKTLVVTAESGFHWVSALDNKVISRTSDNIDLEKHRAFYKVTISKPVDIEKLINKIMDNRPRGVALFPAGTGGSTAVEPGPAVDGIQRDVIGVTISGGNKKIKTGSKGYKTIAFDAEIKDWVIITNSTVAGSTIEFDILKSTLAGYPTTATIISDTNFRPVCTDSYSSTMVALTSWNVNLLEKDIVEFTVTNCDQYTYASLFVYVETPAV